MHAIYVMAAVTTVVTGVSVGGFLRWRSPAGERGFLAVLGVLTLPMCALAFYLVRMPLLDGAVRHLVDAHSWGYGLIATWYAPLTEEPAKVWPLVLGVVRRRITAKNAWRVAVALGLGFGIGELWFIAHLVAASGKFEGLAWYRFMGFFNERFLVCIMHGTFAALTLHFFARGRLVVGLLLAMVAHFVGNFPLYLAQVNVPPLGATGWGVVLQLWIPLYLAAGVVWLTVLATGRGQVVQFVFGNSICPECGAEYPSPLLGVNLFHKRLERCPRCRRWHVVSRFKGGEG